MKKIEFKNVKGNVSDVLSNMGLQALFCYTKNNNDIKINGKRIQTDEVLNNGDELTLFFDEKKFCDRYFSSVFEDENVLIVFKKSGVEVCDSSTNILAILKIFYNEIYAVHRLDRATEGLLIFAKNIDSKNVLDSCFKNRVGVKKNYVADVYGEFPKSNCKKYAHFYKKNPATSLAIINDSPKDGFVRIETDITAFRALDNKKTRLWINLITGKTHQIRAVMAHLGFPLVGDGKYGKAKNGEKLHLCSCSLDFDFDKNSILAYLNDKHISVYPTF